jgi:hypothetical protein
MKIKKDPVDYGKDAQPEEQAYQRKKNPYPGFAFKPPPEPMPEGPYAGCQ